jgi:hypothetical protein
MNVTGPWGLHPVTAFYMSRPTMMRVKWLQEKSPHRAAFHPQSKDLGGVADCSTTVSEFGFALKFGLKGL